MLADFYRKPVIGSLFKTAASVFVFTSLLPVFAEARGRVKHHPKYRYTAYGSADSGILARCGCAGIELVRTSGDDVWVIKKKGSGARQAVELCRKNLRTGEITNSTIRDADIIATISSVCGKESPARREETAKNVFKCLDNRAEHK